MTASVPCYTVGSQTLQMVQHVLLWEYIILNKKKNILFPNNQHALIHVRLRYTFVKITIYYFFFQRSIICCSLNRYSVSTRRPVSLVKFPWQFFRSNPFSRRCGLTLKDCLKKLYRISIVFSVPEYQTANYFDLCRLKLSTTEFHSTFLFCYGVKTDDCCWSAKDFVGFNPS